VIKASHDGYLNAFGVLHERELTLNATGLIVTGPVVIGWSRRRARSMRQCGPWRAFTPTPPST